MATATQITLITEAEYLAHEHATDIKHEYIDGQIYAMSDAKAAHNRIAGNAFRHIANHLTGNPCQPYMSDMKVRIGSKYFYPDVMVDCTNMADDSTYTEQPRLIIEVLSHSTRRLDQTIKRMAYMQIPTLEEYVLIEQEFVEIEVIRRQDNWLPTKYYLGDKLHLQSIGLTLAVEALYERVQNEDMKRWLQPKPS